VEQSRVQALRSELSRRFPRAEVLGVSARQRTGLAAWFERIFDTDLGLVTSPEVDYDVYADGEARLGWFNATITVTSAGAVDGNALLVSFATDIQRRLATENVEIAHCKMTLSAQGFGDDLAALNLVRTDGVPELSHRLADLMTSGELLLNLRAEAAPDTLRSVVHAAMTDLQAVAGAVRLRTVHAEAFSPPRPTPTYRMATA
jgi:hypothetical protein